MRWKSSEFVLPESELTPKAIYLRRRTLLKAMGFLGLSAGLPLAGCELLESDDWTVPAGVLAGTLDGLPGLEARRNRRYHPYRPLTPRQAAAAFTNFHEFTANKDVWQSVDRFVTRPWTLEVAGLVKRPQKFSVDELLSYMPLEERHYRFRCVEAWGMVVPWIGFPLARLLAEVEPLPTARYLRFISFFRPEQAPRQKERPELWPYVEGLTLPEARNELTLVAVGLYGEELPRQHGAPLRLVVPWKYGFKGAKSIVRIELVAEQPATYWPTQKPGEYDFWSNIDPATPHPRWSQVNERLIDGGAWRPTLPFGGYGGFVHQLYAGMQPADPGYGFGSPQTGGP